MWVGTKPKSLSGPPYPGLHSLGGHHGPATSGDPRRWPWQEQTQTVQETDQGPPDLWARWPPCPRSSPAGKHGLDQETGGSLITFIGTAKLGDRANKLMAEPRCLNISTGLKKRVAFVSQNCGAWRRVKGFLSKLSVLQKKKKGPEHSHHLPQVLQQDVPTWEASSTPPATFGFFSRTR